MKNCSLCKQTKDFLLFNKNKSRKDGLNNICRDCSRLKSRDYYLANRELHKKNTIRRSKEQKSKSKEFLLEFLKKNPCVVCGEADPVVLEFNHLRDKKDDVSRMSASGNSITTIKKEIEKCEVLCANCHRRKTAKDFGWYKFPKEIAGSTPADSTNCLNLTDRI